MDSHEAVEDAVGDLADSLGYSHPLIALRTGGPWVASRSVCPSQAMAALSGGGGRFRRGTMVSVRTLRSYSHPLDPLRACLTVYPPRLRSERFSTSRVPPREGLGCRRLTNPWDACMKRREATHIRLVLVACLVFYCFTLPLACISSLCGGVSRA